MQVEHSVLQGCHNNLPNRTGYDFEACWELEACLKTPT